MSQRTVLSNSTIRQVAYILLIGILLLGINGHVAKAEDLRQADLNQLSQQCQRELPSCPNKETLNACQLAAALAEQTLGDNAPRTAELLDNLGSCYIYLDQYKEAEGPIRRALEIRRQTLGESHPLYAASLDSLASLLSTQGHPVEAEAILRRSLLIHEQAPSADGVGISKNLNSLAALYLNQGNFAEAEALLKRCLIIREKMLSPEHPLIAQNINNLAELYRIQGRLHEAEALHTKSLHIWEKIGGPEHLEVARSLNNLATLYFNDGRYSEAEPLHLRSLRIREKQLSPEHLKIANTINSLALLYQAQGRYAEAEVLFRRSLLIREKNLGPNHLDMAQSITNLAWLQYVQGRTAAMTDSLFQAAEIVERELRDTVSETRVQSLLAIRRREEDGVYSLLFSNEVSATAQKLALALRLLRKGRSAEAGALANRLLHRNLGNAAVKNLFNEWQTARQNREALLYRELGILKPDEYRERLRNLTIQANSLEGQLAQVLPEIRTSQPPTLEEIVPAVAQRIPRGRVLIEFVSAQVFHPQAKDNASRYEAPQFMALLLFPDQRIVSVQLGAATKIEELAQRLLNRVYSQTHNS